MDGIGVYAGLLWHVYPLICIGSMGVISSVEVLIDRYISGRNQGGLAKFIQYLILTRHDSIKMSSYGLGCQSMFGHDVFLNPNPNPNRLLNSNSRLSLFRNLYWRRLGLARNVVNNPSL